MEKCKDWLDAKPVTPDSLAAYLDADETENPWMQESVFEEDSLGLHVLVFVTMVIGHVAHLAYLHIGKPEQMSEIIVEAGSSIFEPIVEYGESYGLSALI